MPLDGAVLASIKHELEGALSNGRIDKIIQPEPDEIILIVRAAGANHKLLLSANAQAPRIHLTVQTKTAPPTAPQFCMVLRKHLSGGRILGLRQPSFERILALDIENRTEMGDAVQKTLLIEIMGKHSNIILHDAAGKVLDAIKHVPPSVSAVRTILPGASYDLPPARGKVNPLEADPEGLFPFNDKFAGDELLFIMNRSSSPPDISVHAALFSAFQGVSPLLAGEFCARAGVHSDTLVSGLTGEEADRLAAAFRSFTNRIVKGDFSPQLYHDETGKAVDITPWPFLLYAELCGKPYPSTSEMLETFYTRRDAAFRLRQRTTDLRKVVTTLLERGRKKGIAHEKSLADTRDRDRLRIMGELLTAFLHKVERGAKNFTAENFYDDNRPLEIPLDPTLTPAENAQRYFRQYNKQKRANLAVAEQIRQNDADTAYLESVLAALDNAFNEGDVLEIRNELAEQGFIKRRPAQGGKGQKPRPAQPLRYISSDGYDIYVGKNNTQNDQLTLRTAHATDLWFHTKDIAGSHVILLTRGAEPPERTLLEAANLAAWHSKARESSNVPVDYVQRKHVRKPAGAKPGYVIYDYHKTVYVTPEEPSLK